MFFDHLLTDSGNRHRDAQRPALIATGVPVELIVDNGMHATSGDLAENCLALGIDIRVAPPQRPETKRLQERIRRALAAHTPPK